MQHTAVERFRLVCSRSHLPSLAQSLFFTGTLLGSLVCGPFSDLWGRRTVYLASLGGAAAAGMGATLAPNFGVWVGARIVAGGCILAGNLALDVYRTEVPAAKFYVCQKPYWAGYMHNHKKKLAIR